MWCICVRCCTILFFLFSFCCIQFIQFYCILPFTVNKNEYYVLVSVFSHNGANVFKTVRKSTPVFNSQPQRSVQGVVDLRRCEWWNEQSTRPLAWLLSTANSEKRRPIDEVIKKTSRGPGLSTVGVRSGTGKSWRRHKLLLTLQAYRIDPKTRQY